MLATLTLFAGGVVLCVAGGWPATVTGCALIALAVWRFTVRSFRRYDHREIVRSELDYWRRTDPVAARWRATPGARKCDDPTCSVCGDPGGEGRPMWYLWRRR